MCVFASHIKIRSIIVGQLVASVLGFLGLTCAWADSWHASIDRVETLQDEYYQKYKEVAGHIGIGTAFNGLNYSMHRCAIVGRRLGLKDRVSQFEAELPDVNNASAIDLAGAVASLDSWLTAANYYIDSSEIELKLMWNLECAWQPGLADTFFPIEKQDMQNVFFSVQGTDLLVLGDVDQGFYEKFEKIILDNPQIESVSLGSDGGSLSDALKAGMLIRLSGLETSIYANCNSACPLLFFGGTQRTIWQMNMGLGFHQISSAQEAIDLDDDLYRIVADYVDFMGVDSMSVINWMKSSKPEEVTIIVGDDLCDANAATSIYHLCFGS